MNISKFLSIFKFDAKVKWKQAEVKSHTMSAYNEYYQ